ncbi:MAG: carbon storage regulator [Rubripirellula sp.]
MLVLTRKTDEEILIGNDIKITLVRVKGNTVRIGIEAPRDIRVLRGELQMHDDGDDGKVEFNAAELETPFAHPQEALVQKPKLKPANRLPKADATLTEAHLFTGKVSRADGEVKLTRAPLSGFMSAS